MDLKWMLGSDFHIPYHNKRYLDLWWQVVDWFKPDVVDILGDLDDACPVSRFADGTPQEVMGAVATYAPLVQDFFKELRGKVDGQIHFATGNHEARYDAYVDKKAPAFRDLITPELLWHTDTHGIELSYYNAPPVHRFGDIYVHHGISISKHAGESVRNDVSEFGVSIIRGHSHRAGTYYKYYELPDQLLRGFEIGHLTDIRSDGMSYTQQHNWTPGFAVAHIESGSSRTTDGYWPHIQFIEISADYTCVVDGKLFKA
jgi:predicted phosphodiesterase